MVPHQISCCAQREQVSRGRASRGRDGSLELVHEIELLQVLFAWLLVPTAFCCFGAAWLRVSRRSAGDTPRIGARGAAPTSGPGEADLRPPMGGHPRNQVRDVANV